MNGPPRKCDMPCCPRLATAYSESAGWHLCPCCANAAAAIGLLIVNYRTTQDAN